MPRFLALEWNDTEARVAVAATRGDQVVVEHAFVVSLRSSVPGPDQPPVDVGQRLAAALAARGLGKLEALVAVGRSNVELRQLSLPPAPDEELPDMVRFQAMREFGTIQEDWPLDYMPIDDLPDQPRTVLAAAIAPAQVTQVQEMCQPAGLRLKKLVLRPCASASLLERARSDGRMRVRLLVDLLADEAELTVMIDRKVIFLRTARLPSDPLADADGAGVLLSEIRRTVAAVQNQLGGRKVESIVLCGSEPAHAALAEMIAERLNTPTESFDPFAGLQLQDDAARTPPEHPGRFAALLGMLCDELREGRHAIDFLHPRHKPEPPSRNRTYLIAAAVAAVVVLGLFLYGFLAVRQLAAQRQQLEDDLKRLEAEAIVAGKDEKAAKEIEAWAAGDIVLLDELQRLSSKLPPAQETMLTQFDFRSTRTGGEIKIEGGAKSVATLKVMEEAVNDKTHQVAPKGKGENPAQKSYPLKFGSVVQIRSPEKQGEKQRPPVPAVTQAEKRP